MVPTASQIPPHPNPLADARCSALHHSLPSHHLTRPHLTPHRPASPRSFRQSRWAGTLANTRGFGDAHYKQLGVFAEPAITSRLLSPASSYAFLILLSDGVTDMISDQEICDLCRGHRDPSRAAKAVVSFAESIGGCVDL